MWCKSVSECHNQTSTHPGLTLASMSCPLSVSRTLMTVARVAGITCTLLCLFAFILCTVSGHMSSILHRVVLDIETDHPGRMSLGNIDEIDAIISSHKMPEPSGQSPPVKSKLARLLSRHPNPHRYELAEPEGTVAKDYQDCGYHLAFTLLDSSTNEYYPSKLLTKFSNSLSSILANLNSTGLDPGSLCVHLITDPHIRPYVRHTIEKVHEELILKSNLFHHNHHKKQQAEERGETVRPLTRYFFIDSSVVESRLEYLLPTLRSYFTHKPDSYYSNALFFYSMVLHRVLPSSVASRIVMLDVDVQLDSNLLELYEQFGRFNEDQIIGLAYDQQPVYRHILSEYRRNNPDTSHGDAPSAGGSGFPGFNSGVMLLHLRRMRESVVYNSLLDSVVIGHLAHKYHFRGHLGDQDFYTLVALDYRQLFYTLPCVWNRQLCQWWRFHGYSQVFHDYHRCESGGPVKLYHGNCNSALPGLATTR